MSMVNLPTGLKFFEPSSTGNSIVAVTAGHDLSLAPLMAKIGVTSAIHARSAIWFQRHWFASSEIDPVPVSRAWQ